MTRDAVPGEPARPDAARDRALAHALGNLIHAVLGHLEFARADTPEGSPARASLDAAEQAARDAIVLVRRELSGAGGVPPVPAPGAVAAAAVPPGATRARLLVVEDEPLVRDFNVKALRRAGFDAEGAADGAAALARYRAGERFDLVILDLGMPGSDGTATFSALRAIDPAARGLLTTGQCFTGEPVPPAADGFCGALAKPFTGRALIREIERILGETPR